jgi:hypothetical protein
MREMGAACWCIAPIIGCSRSIEINAVTQEMPKTRPPFLDGDPGLLARAP